MGTSRSGGQLIAKFDKMSELVLQGSADDVKAGAEIVRTAALSLATPPTTKTGGSLNFSGTKSNRKIGVNVKVIKPGPDASAMAKATGPMHWLEGGVKPHPVTPKSLGGSRRARGDFVANAFGTGTRSLQFGKKTGSLRFADGGFAKYARKAGKFPALKVWTRAIDRAEPLYVKGTADRVARRIGTAIR